MGENGRFHFDTDSPDVDAFVLESGTYGFKGELHPGCKYPHQIS
jgi:hypothetical protein